MDLQTYLLKNRFTQRELSENTGVTRTTISNFINGHRKLSRLYAEVISKWTHDEVPIESMIADPKRVCGECGTVHKRKKRANVIK